MTTTDHNELVDRQLVKAAQRLIEVTSAEPRSLTSVEARVRQRARQRRSVTAAAVLAVVVGVAGFIARLPTDASDDEVLAGPSEQPASGSWDTIELPAGLGPSVGVAALDDSRALLVSQPPDRGPVAFEIDAAAGSVVEVASPPLDRLSEGYGTGEGGFELLPGEGRAWLLSADGAEMAVLSYDPVSQAWSEHQPAPLAARVGAATTWTDGQLFTWGGLDDRRTPLADGAIYDPEQDRWTTLPGSPAPGRGDATALWDGTHVLIVGGSDEVMARSDTLLFDPASRAWTTGPTVPASGDLVLGGQVIDVAVAAVSSGSRVEAFLLPRDELEWRRVELNENLRGPAILASGPSGLALVEVSSGMTVLGTGVDALHPGPAIADAESLQCGAAGTVAGPYVVLVRGDRDCTDARFDSSAAIVTTRVA